jgi:endoglucanase
MPQLATERRTFDLFVLGCAGALLVSGCLTPPSLTQKAASSPALSAPVAARGPRDFGKSSRELIAGIELGWNLGNSLDVPEGETAWGNPKVTPELLRAVAKAGFGLVRIPVTWSLHTGPGPQFVIDPAWLSRVAEVVGYARDAGLYAIINVHHDGADGFAKVEWLRLTDDSGALSEATDAAVRARFVAVWDQIASKFQGYGEELLFESMNEIHEGYGKPEPRYFTLVNGYNQLFVERVRASGGNNAQRHLVVPGYNTNIDHTLAGFELPKDPTPGRLIVSAHYYDPYLFALQGKTNTWGKSSPGNDGWGQEDFVVQQFDKLKTRFIDQGMPVILGEYGACSQQGFEDYRRYYVEYVTKAAADRAILPVFWDNGAEGSGGEKFGLFSRSSYEPLHPRLLEAMLRAATSKYTLSDVVPPRP